MAMWQAALGSALPPTELLQLSALIPTLIRLHLQTNQLRVPR